MLKKLVETQASNPLGRQSSHHLFEIITGEYSGRRVALMATSATDIELTWADPPYNNWSTSQTILSDANDDSCDASIDANGNIYLVYMAITTGYIVSRKLSFVSGVWSVGSQVEIYNGSTCYNPSVSIEPSGKLWVTFTRYFAPTFSMYVKSSDDDGATWGTGATDTGTLITSGVTSLFPKVFISLNEVMLFFTVNGNSLQLVKKQISGSTWSSAQIITSYSVSDGYDMTLRPDGRVGLLFGAAIIYYMEYDGSSWSAAELILDGATNPNIIFINNDPVALMSNLTDGSKVELMQSIRKAGQFTTPVPLDPSCTFFDKVLLYDASDGTFEDLTTQAKSYISSDTYHSISGCLVKDTADCVYVGMDVPFRYIHLALNTVGVGGEVTFSYWDGDSWVAVSPVSGDGTLSAISEAVLLFTDDLLIPSQWQKSNVNSINRFWVKLEVTTGFSTGPVAEMVHPIPESDRFQVRR